MDSNTFKVSTTIAAAIVTVHQGGIRELHWHPNADEWQYYIERLGKNDGVRYRRPRDAPWTFKPEMLATS